MIIGELDNGSVRGLEDMEAMGDELRPSMVGGAWRISNEG